MNKNYFKNLKKFNTRYKMFQEGGQVQDPNAQQPPQQQPPQDPSAQPAMSAAGAPPPEQQQQSAVPPEVLQELQAKAKEFASLYSKGERGEFINTMSMEISKLVLKMLSIPFSEPAKTLNPQPSTKPQDGAPSQVNSFKTVSDRPKSYYAK